MDFTFFPLNFARILHTFMLIFALILFKIVLLSEDLTNNKVSDFIFSCVEFSVDLALNLARILRYFVLTLALILILLALRSVDLT